MIVCIAEKPSVARDIADVLGAKNKKDGYIEGNGYQVTWTFGPYLCAGLTIAMLFGTNIINWYLSFMGF